MTPASPGPVGDSLVGRRLGDRYRIVRRLAHGGMAVVYEAHDERLERPVAIKVLASPYAEDPEFAARFVDEARTAASFSHPNLAHVYDAGSDGGVQYIAMELLAGRHSLRDLIRASGSLAVGEAVQVARDVLAGLAAIHARGLVHCDVKSGNVMTGGGETKLIDFGIARSLQADRARRTSVGSLHAMSPEQLRGEALTPASDLFAVGVVLFESLTGRVPFPGATPAEVMAAHAGGPIGPPSASASGIGEALDAAVLQALAHDPAQRFASAEAMDAALGAAVAASTPHRAGVDDTTTVIAAAAPTRLPAAPLPHCPSRPRRRSPPSLAAFAVLAVPALVAALLVFGLVTRGNGDPTGSQPPAGSPTPPPGTVLVPNTIGLSEAEAEAAARAAGLNWRIEWRVVAGETPGVYDQEPAAGTPVQPGSRFVMYAYRSR